MGYIQSVIIGTHYRTEQLIIESTLLELGVSKIFFIKEVGLDHIHLRDKKNILYVLDYYIASSFLQIFDINNFIPCNLSEMIIIMDKFDINTSNILYDMGIFNVLVRPFSASRLKNICKSYIYF